MLPYLLLLGFITLWIVLEKEAINRTSFWVPLVVLVLFATIRSYKVGTDTAVYTLPFRRHFDVDRYMFDPDVEYGFQLLEYSLLHFTHNYFWLFFITSLLIVSCFLLTIKKYSVDYSASIFLFIAFGAYTFSFNGLRQGIAIAMVAFGIRYLIDKKLIPFLIVIALASLIHTSALFIIPFYFLTHLKIDEQYKLALSFTISLLASSFLVSYIASTNERYEDYAVVSEQAGGLLTLSFFTVLMVLLQLFKYRFKVKDKIFTTLLTYYSVGVIFIIPVALLGTNPSGPQRLLSYFSWTVILLVPYALRKLNQLIVYVSLYMVAILYFIMTTSTFSNLIPYTINPIFKVLS